MKLNIAKGTSTEVLLRQLGATDIKKVNGMLYFIKFKIDENLQVSYVYNINTKDQYFLQRIKPYPIPEGIFKDEYEIVSFIKSDLAKFNYVKNNDNFDLFLEITNKANNIAHDMELLFLNYIVDKNKLEKISTELNDVLDIIEHSKNPLRTLNIE